MSGKRMRAGPSLTTKEKEVLSLLKKGWSDKEIAAELGIPVRRAQYYVGRLRLKFGFASRRQFMLGN